MLATLLITAIVILILAVILALIEQKRNHTSVDSILSGFLHLGLGILAFEIVIGFLSGNIGIWIK